MRLIDADELRKDIVERGAQLSGCYSAGIARYMDRMLANVLADVDISPTVDAVPVVRCKDCKCSEVFQNDSSGVMARYCNALRLVRMVADDDYCSYGERRE